MSKDMIIGEKKTFAVQPRSCKLCESTKYENEREGKTDMTKKSIQESVPAVSYQTNFCSHR